MPCTISSSANHVMHSVLVAVARSQVLHSPLHLPVRLIAKAQNVRLVACIWLHLPFASQDFTVQRAQFLSVCGVQLCAAAALAFPIGMDNTGTPAGMQISAPPGSDGLMLSLGLAMEKLFGPMPPPPTTAACSGCTANVSYVPVWYQRPCMTHSCFFLHGSLLLPAPTAQCTRELSAVMSLIKAVSWRESCGKK